MVNQMDSTLASSITKAASKQTYYTIRFLVDRERVEDAYRTYAYFRWVDDVLDAPSGSAAERKAFLERQKSLLEACYRGEPPQDVDMQENMLVELVHHREIPLQPCKFTVLLQPAQTNGVECPQIHLIQIKTHSDRNHTIGDTG